MYSLIELGHSHSRILNHKFQIVEKNLHAYLSCFLEQYSPHLKKHQDRKEWNVRPLQFQFVLHFAYPLKINRIHYHMDG